MSVRLLKVLTKLKGAIQPARSAFVLFLIVVGLGVIVWMLRDPSIAEFMRVALDHSCPWNPWARASFARGGFEFLRVMDYVWTLRNCVGVML